MGISKKKLKLKKNLIAKAIIDQQSNGNFKKYWIFNKKIFFNYDNL